MEYVEMITGCVLSRSDGNCLTLADQTCITLANQRCACTQIQKRVYHSHSIWLACKIAPVAV